MFDSAHVDCNTDAPHEQLTSYMFLLSPLHPPHRTILAAICSELELGQCSEAGRKLDVRVETIRQHRGMLADLIKTDEHHREYIQVRGLAREAGIDILNGRCSHELVQVIIEAQSAQTDVYTRHSILAEADKVFETAQPGHIVAMETKSNIEPFWLVRVVEKVESLGESSTFDDWGVKLKCNRGGRALIVTKLMLSSLDASNTFNDHVAKLQITVPAALLRVGDLVGNKLMEEKEVTVRSTRSRAAVRATRGDTSDKYYALKQEARQEIVLKCRALDLPA